MKKLLLTWLMCCSWCAFAMELGHTSSGDWLTPHLQYLEDPQGQLTLEDMSRPEVAALFKSPGDPKQTLNFGITQSAYWVRLPLQQAANNDDDWLIELSYALLNKVTFYAPGVEPVVTGGDYPIATRPFFDRYFVFPIKLKATQQHYFLRIESDNSITLPLRIWTERDLIPRVQQNLAIQFLYFGSMMGLALFTLFMYFLARDKRHALYAFYVVCISLSMISGSGVARMFFWPDVGAFDSIARNFFIAAAGAISIYLSGVFLQIEYSKKRVAWGWKLLSAYFAAYAVLLLVGLQIPLPVDLLNKALLVGGLVAGTTILVTVFRVMHDRRRSLRFFGLSWLVFWAGIMMGIGRTVGLVPSNIWTAHSVQIASLCELVLLFLALADQFRAEQQRRYAAQAQLVEQLKFNNDALEKTVSDRTLKLQQSLSHEQSVLEQYKRFGALISHEFRNPLGIIKSQLSLLRIEQERNELQLAKRLSVMGSACDRLSAMFDKWLQGDKLSTALKQMDMNPIPVRSWLAHFVATNVYCLLGSPVQVRGATDDMLLMADEYLIDIALGNLVDNARKYAGDATVAIEVRLRPGQLGLAVVDQGPGIAVQHQPRVFDEYFRVSPEIGVHGVGLGLSIVRRIVAAHGGELELQSPPGMGCTFTVWLPLNHL